MSDTYSIHYSPEAKDDLREIYQRNSVKPLASAMGI